MDGQYELNKEPNKVEKFQKEIKKLKKRRGKGARSTKGRGYPRPITSPARYRRATQLSRAKRRITKRTTRRNIRRAGRR